MGPIHCNQPGRRVGQWGEASGGDECVYCLVEASLLLGRAGALIPRSLRCAVRLLCRAAEKEDGGGAYNMLLRSELLGCPSGARSPEKGSSTMHVSSPSKRWAGQGRAAQRTCGSSCLTQHCWWGGGRELRRGSRVLNRWGRGISAANARPSGAHNLTPSPPAAGLISPAAPRASCSATLPATRGPPRRAPPRSRPTRGRWWGTTPPSPPRWPRPRASRARSRARRSRCWTRPPWPTTSTSTWWTGPRR